MAGLGSRRSWTLLWVMAVASPVCAAADSAAPQRYEIAVTGQTVRICVVDFEGRGCSGNGLLRRDKSSGQVVEITTCDDQGCFQDDCVPAGEYQYGLEKPLACVSAAAYTEYFHEASVPAPAPGTTCTSGLNPPAAYSGSVPWGSEQMVCTYRDGHSSGCGSRAGPVLTLNGLLILVGALLWRRRARRALQGA